MQIYKLSAEPRTELGKKAAKALRKENLIPVVLNGGKLIQFEKNDKGEWTYNGKLQPGQKAVMTTREGKGVISTDLVVKFNDIRKLVYTPNIYAIELTVGANTCMAVLKDIQFHPVDDSILHIDLLQVTEQKPIVMNVPVHVTGHAAGVKAGGKLYLSMKKVKVKGIYTEIPDTLVVDVTNLQIGQAIKVGSLHFDNYELASSKELVIAGVRATRQSADAAPAEGEEAEAAADAPAAE